MVAGPPAPTCRLTSSSRNLPPPDWTEQVSASKNGSGAFGYENDANGGAYKQPVPETSEEKARRKRRATCPGRPKVVDSEVAFLEEGLAEVQRAAQMVYCENMELRTRMEKMAMLLGAMASYAPLPHDVQVEYDELVRAAIPAKDSFDPQEGDLDDAIVREQNERHCASFKSRAEQLARCISRCPPPGARGGWGGTSPHSDSTGDSDAGPEGEPSCRSDDEEHQQSARGSTSTSEPLAILDVSLWERTSLVAKELVSGWY